MSIFRSLAGISACVNPLAAQLVADETFPPHKIMFVGFVLGTAFSIVILSYLNRWEYALTVKFFTDLSYQESTVIVRLTVATLAVVTPSLGMGLIIWYSAMPFLPTSWNLATSMLALTLVFHAVLLLLRQRAF